jgi:hypothetical protein
MSYMISYNRNDWAQVEPVAQFLRSGGLELWIDQEQIKPPMVWRLEILKAPRRTDGTICFLSRSYVASEICRMELFLARSFDKPIFPVMLEECWGLLDAQEETKYLSTIFVARLRASKIVGLHVSEDEIRARLLRAIKYRLGAAKPQDHNVYISFPNRSGMLATEVYSGLSAPPIRPWIATMDCEVGEDWRRAQVLAMSRAKAHVILVSKDFLSDKSFDNDVLRTEVLLSEAFQLPTVCVMSPELADNPVIRDQVYSRLANGEQAFRRLTERQWFRHEHVSGALCTELERIVLAHS